MGVVIEDDGMTAEEFKTEMLKLNEELNQLNSQAHILENKINENINGLFS